MTVTVATKRLIELLTDALATADGDVGGGIRIGCNRSAAGSEPGVTDWLTSVSTTGSVLGHTWIACTGNIEASVWPEESARNVLAICKSLVKKGSEDEQHTVDIALSGAPIVDGVTADGEHPGWLVTVQETPALFDSDTEFQFHAAHQSRFPVGQVAATLSGGYSPDFRFKSVPLTQWSSSVVKPLCAVAARRKHPIRMFRQPGTAAHLVQIGDSWLGAAMAQAADPERSVDAPDIEAMLPIEAEE